MNINFNTSLIYLSRCAEEEGITLNIYFDKQGNMIVDGKERFLTNNGEDYLSVNYRNSSEIYLTDEIVTKEYIDNLPPHLKVEIYNFIRNVALLRSI